MATKNKKKSSGNTFIASILNKCVEFDQQTTKFRRIPVTKSSTAFHTKFGI